MHVFVCVCTVHACYEWFVALHDVQLTLSDSDHMQYIIA